MAEKTLVTNQKPKATASLVTGVTMAVVGSAFQYGYNVAVMNAPEKEILSHFFPCNNETDVGYNETTMECGASFKGYRDNLYAVAVAAFPFAGMIGSLLVGSVVKKFGRRGGLMFNNLLSFLAALCLAISKFVNAYPLIVVGRIFIGMFAGLATGIVPMYISEISPKEWRGAIGVLNQLLITIGILVAQILGLGAILGNANNWPILFAITFLPSLLQILCVPFMPKSPRYLLIDLHQEDAARNELVKLRGTDDVSAEMDEMRAEAEAAAKTDALSIPQLIGEKSVRWQLITVVAMMIAQQLSGINAVFFYTNKIFATAGIPEGNPQDLASVSIGAVNVFMTIVSVVVIEYAGRKKLMVYGFGTMIFWCLALTIVLTVLLGYENPADAGSLPYLSIACIVGYIVGFAVGPGPIPWIVTAEFFTQAARPAATMVSCVVNWMCNFIIGISFPSVATATGPYVFLVFMAVCVCITIYLQIVMPETRNKTFGEINALFAQRNGIEVTDNTGVDVPLKQMNSRQDDL